MKKKAFFRDYPPDSAVSGGGCSDIPGNDVGAGTGEKEIVAAAHTVNVY